MLQLIKPVAKRSLWSSQKSPYPPQRKHSKQTSTIMVPPDHQDDYEPIPHEMMESYYLHRGIRGPEISKQIIQHTFDHDDAKSSLTSSSSYAQLGLNWEKVETLKTRIIANGIAYQRASGINTRLVQLERLLNSVGYAFSEAYQQHSETIEQANENQQMQTRLLTMVVTGGMAFFGFSPLATLLNNLLFGQLNESSGSYVSESLGGIATWYLRFGIANPIADDWMTDYYSQSSLKMTDSPETIKRKLANLSFELRDFSQKSREQIIKSYTTHSHLIEQLQNFHQKTHKIGDELLTEFYLKTLDNIRSRTRKLDNLLKIPEPWKNFIQGEEQYQDLVKDIETRMWAAWLLSSPPKRGILGNVIGPNRTIKKRLHALGIINLDQQPHPHFFRLNRGDHPNDITNEDAIRSGRSFSPYHSNRKAIDSLYQWAEMSLSSPGLISDGSSRSHNMSHLLSSNTE